MTTLLNRKTALVCSLLVMVVWAGAQLWPVKSEVAAAGPASSNRRPLPQQVNRKVFDNASAANFELLPAVPNQRIQLWSITYTCGSAPAGSSVTIQSGSSSISGTLYASAMRINDPVGNALTDSAVPYLESNVGEALNVTLSSGFPFTGSITWTSNPN